MLAGLTTDRSARHFDLERGGAAGRRDAALLQPLFECDVAFEGTVAAPYYQRGLVSRLLAAQVRGLAAGEGPVVGDAYREALGRVRATPAIQQDLRLWLLRRITELEQTGQEHPRARATLVHDDPRATDPRSDVFLLLEVRRALDLQLDEKETAGLRDWVLERLAGPGPVEMEEAEPALVAELEGVGSFADRRRVRPRVVRLLTPVTRAVDDRREHALAVTAAVRSTRP